MKKSTNQSDTNKNTKKSDSNQSSRSLAQSQSPIDETVTENSQKKAKETMKNTIKDDKDEDVGHPCQDCLIININPNLTMHVCSVINQYMYLCGHCGESTNVRLKSFETVSQKITQKSTLKSSQKSTPHKPPQNKPTAAAGTPNTTTSKSRLRSKSSDMDTSSDQKEDAEEETSQAQDNNGKTCPECNGSWETLRNPQVIIQIIRRINVPAVIMIQPMIQQRTRVLRSDGFAIVKLHRRKMRFNRINHRKIALKLTINQQIQHRVRQIGSAHE